MSYHDGTIEVETLRAELAVLELRPGDQLVLMCPGQLSRSAKEYMHDTMKQFFPDRKVIVLENGLTIGVIREALDTPQRVQPTALVE